MNHKYLHRETGKPIYFGEEGKRIFDKRAESANYKYVGPISQKRQAAEEEEALASAKVEEEEEDDEEYLEKQKEASKKTTAKTKELTNDEVKDLTKEKKIPLKKEAPKKETPKKEEQPEQEEEEEDDEDEDNEEANEKRLKEAIDKLKPKDDGKGSGKAEEDKKG